MVKVKELKRGIKNWVDKLKKHQLIKALDYLHYFSKTELEHKPQRIIYVDVAESIQKEGKKHWKASLVENKKHLKSYDIGAFPCSYPAENAGIYKVLEYLIEQKWEGKLLIYTDSNMSLHTFNNSQILSYYKKHGKLHPETLKKWQKLPLVKAKILALENNIDVKLEWVRGHENHADYYSRLSAPII